MPRSRCSSSSSSRSDCSSRCKSASRFLICHHFISALLSCGPHHPRHGFCHLFPLRFLDDKLFSSLIRKPVVLEFPIPIRSHLPFRGDPSPFAAAGAARGKASRAASGENHSWSAEYACRSGGREQDHKEEFARSTCQGCLEEDLRVPVSVWPWKTFDHHLDTMVGTRPSAVKTCLENLWLEGRFRTGQSPSTRAT